MLATSNISLILLYKVEHVDLNMVDMIIIIHQVLIYVIVNYDGWGYLIYEANLSV